MCFAQAKKSLSYSLNLLYKPIYIFHSVDFKMNVQPCARCGYGVYPAEKINCIDQVSCLSLLFWTIINV